MTQHKIKHGVAITVRPGWVSSKYVIDLSTVMFAAGNLAIAIVICLASWVGQTLQFESFREVDQAEIRI